MDKALHKLVLHRTLNVGNNVVSMDWLKILFHGGFFIYLAAFLCTHIHHASFPLFSSAEPWHPDLAVPRNLYIRLAVCVCVSWGVISILFPGDYCLCLGRSKSPCSTLPLLDGVRGGERWGRSVESLSPVYQDRQRMPLTRANSASPFHHVH